MTTIRDITKRSLRMIGVLGAGEEPEADAAADALEAVQSILLALPGMWWRDVAVTVAYTASENERVRVNSDDAVTVTIPNDIGSERAILGCCGQVTLICEGYDDRAPKDGARVQVTDTNSNVAATYYYCADLAAWMPVESLTLSSLVPLNADMHDYLAALLALRLAPEYEREPSAVVVAMAQSGQVKMRARYGKRAGVLHDPSLIPRAQRGGLTW